MTRSLRGRSRVYRPITAQQFPVRGSTVVVPSTPELAMSGTWEPLAPILGSGSPYDTAVRLGDDLIIATNGSRVQSYSISGDAWTDQGSIFGGPTGWTGGWISLIVGDADADNTADSLAMMTPYPFVSGAWHGIPILYDVDDNVWGGNFDQAPAPVYLFGWCQTEEHWLMVGGYDGNGDAAQDGLYRYNILHDSWNTDQFPGAGPLATAPHAGQSYAWIEGDTLWATFFDFPGDPDLHVASYSISGDAWTDHPDLAADVASIGFGTPFTARLGADRVLLMLGGDDASVWNTEDEPPTAQPSIPVHSGQPFNCCGLVQPGRVDPDGVGYAISNPHFVGNNHSDFYRFTLDPS